MSAVWSEELKGEGVSVLSADPGDMDTALHRIALPDADPATLKRPETAAHELSRMIASELHELALLRREKPPLASAMEPLS
jgi:hypothetical protein